MHFSPFISADIRSGGPSPGKPAITTGQDGLFAAHLSTAAREQTGGLRRADIKATEEGLMSLIAVAHFEENTLHAGVPSAILFDTPTHATDQAPSSLKWQGATAPEVFFNDNREPSSGDHPALQRPATNPLIAAETVQRLAHAFEERTVETRQNSPLAKEFAASEAERPFRTAGPGGGPPLTIFDNTGGEHRSSKVAETGTGVRFNEPSVGETATRNSAGQTFTIRQFGQTEETFAPLATGNRPAIETNSPPQDAKAHYIHSNLPNRVLRASGDTGSSQQQENGSNQQKDSDSSRSVLHQVQADIRSSPPTLAMTGQDSEPLLFSHSPMTTPPVATVAQTESAMLRLPSGLFVPHGTVIDQVIAHFSTNSRLESGSVSLQLHPRELGALRLEIKVEQDNIKAHITVQNPQAQEMIDRHLPRLREALEQQGLHLQQVQVTIAAEDNTNGRRFQGNPQQEQAAGRSLHNRLTPPISAPETGEPSDYATRTTGSISVHA